MDALLEYFGDILLNYQLSSGNLVGHLEQKVALPGWATKAGAIISSGSALNGKRQQLPECDRGQPYASEMPHWDAIGLEAS